MDRDKPLAREGYELMAAAFEVHREQGGGMAEGIYQECLELELASRGIPFEAQRPPRVHYKSHELQARYVPDLMVYGMIVVELKAVAALVPDRDPAFDFQPRREHTVIIPPDRKDYHIWSQFDPCTLPLAA